MLEELHEWLLDLYRQVDAEVAAAGPKCVASGKCCRFKEYGHRLYLSGLEAAVLLAAAPPYEQPVSADDCPFQKDRLCTAREPRPLGCRIFFCDPAYQETALQITEKYLARLKEMTIARGLDWEYGPLDFFLNRAEQSNVPKQAAAPAPTRRELPLLTLIEN
jgi:hypothetical protein